MSLPHLEGLIAAILNNLTAGAKIQAKDGFFLPFCRQLLDLPG